MALEDEENMAPTSRRANAYDAAICQGSAHRSGLERVYRRRRGAAGRAGENAARAARSRLTRLTKSLGFVTTDWRLQGMNADRLIKQPADAHSPTAESMASVAPAT